MTTIDRISRDHRDAAIGFEQLPVREQVLDRLADLMIDADDILEFLDSERATDLRGITPDIVAIFDHVNRLMARLSD